MAGRKGAKTRKGKGQSPTGRNRELAMTKVVYLYIQTFADAGQIGDSSAFRAFKRTDVKCEMWWDVKCGHDVLGMTY